MIRHSEKNECYECFGPEFVMSPRIYSMYYYYYYYYL